MSARHLTRLVIVAAALHSFIVLSAEAHPASGIVVNDRGQVFFIYTGHAVMKVDPDGKLETFREVKDGHWLALDPRGSFARTQPKYFQRITNDGARPALIFAGGGAPITVGADGNLYYASGPDDDTPGGLTLTQEHPGGTRTKFSAALAQALNKIDDGVTALAAGPDGAIYVGTWTSLFKVKPDESVTTIASPIEVPDCDFDPADHKPTSRRPYIRGLAVDPEGNVFAAATVCHCLLKVTPDGHVSTALKVERPWTPTGVAILGRDKFVLEYTNANGPATEGWRVRVRKLNADRKVTTLVTLPQN